MPLVPVLRAGVTIPNPTTGTEVAAAGNVGTATAQGSGVSPFGQRAAASPAVPATGVTATNVNDFPCQVVIAANGATITNVSVNGATAGTAAGTYYVPAGQTISIAYTVATPTWAWTSAANLPGLAGLLNSSATLLAGQTVPLASVSTS